MLTLAVDRSLKPRDRFDEFRDELPFHLKERLLRSKVHNVYENNCVEFLKTIAFQVSSQSLRSSLVLSLCSKKHLRSLLAGLVNWENLKILNLAEKVEIVWIALFFKKSETDLVSAFLQSIYFQERSRGMRHKLITLAAGYDPKGQLMDTLYSLISENDPLDLIEKLFRKYSPELSIQYIQSKPLKASFVAGFPHKERLNPQKLLDCGYAKVDLKEIFRIWITSWNEMAVFQARGKWRDWGVNRIELKRFENEIFMPARRNIMLCWINLLTDQELHLLARCDIWPNAPTPSLEIAYRIIENQRNVFISFPKERQFLIWGYLYRAVETDFKFVGPFFQFLIKDRVISSDPKRECRFFINILPQCIQKYRLDLVPIMIERVRRTSCHFELMKSLARHRATLPYIFNAEGWLQLNVEQKVYLMQKTIHRGDSELIAEVIQSLRNLCLPSEETIEMLFAALEEFPEHALLALESLSSFGLSANERLKVVAKWSEIFLNEHWEELIFNPGITALTKEEWALLYLDGLTFICDDQMDEYLAHFLLMEFGLSIRLEFFIQMAVRQEQYILNGLQKTLERLAINREALQEELSLRSTHWRWIAFDAKNLSFQ